MGCQDDLVVAKVCDLYDKISRLETLKPSKDVNTLFTQLVLTCIPPSAINVSKLCRRVQEIRSNLIRLCAEAEGLLETHFSTLLGSLDHPLDHLNIFPYLANYLSLSRLEFTLLRRHHSAAQLPTRIAFVGSGPLPLTSLILATNHLPAAAFHNYDIDPTANSLASRLVSSHPDLSKRMFFHTTDIMDVFGDLKDYEVVFLAALVGMDGGEKARVVDHLAEHMAPGAILMVRSAHGARAFLYPVVDPCSLRGFEVLSVFHPSDEVINSVVIARKLAMGAHPLDHQGIGGGSGPLILPCKCSDQMQPFGCFNQLNMVEELAIDEHL
ncbi:Nicotianamine synthase 3 [Sarracenia purpurea var. burkii]